MTLITWNGDGLYPLLDLLQLWGQCAWLSSAVECVHLRYRLPRRLFLFQPWLSVRMRKTALKRRLRRKGQHQQARLLQSLTQESCFVDRSSVRMTVCAHFSLSVAFWYRCWPGTQDTPIHLTFSPLIQSAGWVAKEPWDVIRWGRQSRKARITYNLEIVSKPLNIPSRLPTSEYN